MITSRAQQIILTWVARGLTIVGRRGVLRVQTIEVVFLDPPLQGQRVHFCRHDGSLLLAFPGSSTWVAGGIQLLIPPDEPLFRFDYVGVDPADVRACYTGQLQSPGSSPQSVVVRHGQIYLR